MVPAVDAGTIWAKHSLDYVVNNLGPNIISMAHLLTSTEYVTIARINDYTDWWAALTPPPHIVRLSL